MPKSHRAEMWTDVKVGALYGALKRLAGEGRIAEVRSERAGRFPERTVYEITMRGCEALRQVVVRPDPFDRALAMFHDLHSSPPGRATARL